MSDEMVVNVAEAPKLPEMKSELPPQEKVYTAVTWFLADIAPSARVELTSEIWNAMVEYAKQYLVISSGLSWEKFKELDAVQREAWMEAAADLVVRNALESKGE